MADTSKASWIFLGGCREAPQEAVKQEQPKPVTPAQPPQCKVPTCESSTAPLDRYYVSERDIVPIYEGISNDCLRKEYDSEILTRCAAYYSETFEKYKSLKDETESRMSVVQSMTGKKCMDEVIATHPNACAYDKQSSEIIGQLEIVNDRLPTFGKMIEITEKLKALKTASNGLKAKLDEYLKAENDVRFISAINEPIIARLKTELGSWQRAYDKSNVKTGNMNDQITVRQTAIDEYQKQVDDSKAAETAVKDDLKAAVTAYETARSEFGDAYLSAQVGFNQNERLLVDGNKTLSAAKKALKGVSAPVRKIEEWGGGGAKKGQIEEWGNEKPKQKQVEGW